MCQVRSEPPRSIQATPRPSGVRRRLLVLGGILGVAGLAASWLPITSKLEQVLGLGLLFAARGPLPPPAEVAVVGVSRDAARAIGQTTELDTWSRDLHGRLVDRLTGGGASAVVFDLTFHERRPGIGDDVMIRWVPPAGVQHLPDDAQRN